VVVVGRGRAARARERGEAGARGGPLGLVVDVRPDRIELDEPLEERRLLGEAARRPLVEVVVAVDEAGRREPALAVDGPVVAGEVPGRGARADSDDAVVLDPEVAVGVLGAGGVHRRDRAALDDGARAHAARSSAGAIRSAASRTASRIFS